ncbi:AAA domain-containing protein [Streptomyces sp. AK02-01A]|uniref:AAA domain-containing protein n=1 Tax=Streptomyces sp. AK02-01A TaxID=3028648 RepID=UPI0029B8A0C5|nr:AAA domain-containing protein [Streptomyces sp. AK02-01A]MDX3854223.1 AAA domain-containing protein [Streptomyces sp. AK02-01A]
MRANNSEAVHRTRQLIEYMREIVRGSYKPVRDSQKYPEVLWLSGLPDDKLRRHPDGDRLLLKVPHRPPRPVPVLPDVLAGWVDSEAAATATPEVPSLAESGPGQGWEEDENGDVFEVSEIRREEAHEVLRAYSRWLEVWRQWSEKERFDRPYRELHQQLYRMVTRIQQDGEEYEAVLGVGFLNIGAVRPSARIARHILTAPLILAMDPTNMAITVALASGDPARLEDSEFLGADEGYSTRLLSPLRDRVDAEGFHPLSRDSQEVLGDWSERAFGTDRAVAFHRDWGRPAADPILPVPTLGFAPAIILRQRGQGALVNFYDGIANRLAQPGAIAPLGLAQLLYQLGAEDRRAWGTAGGRDVPPALGPDPLFPLLSNEAQREVLRRLQSDTGVVVQGPPGTGKTHTIANLVCALLADGKRVLVTSEKSQALRVLRQQLPAELRSLCVFQGGRREEGSGDLEQSVRALSQLSATQSTERLDVKIKGHEALRSALSDTQARLRDELRAVREAEWYEHLDVAPGYEGRLAEIVETVAADAPKYDWMPALPASAPREPSLGEDEAQRLMGLVSRHGAGVLEEHAARCPDPADFVAPVLFEEAVSALGTALRSCAEASSDKLSLELADRGSDLIATLVELLDAAEHALQSEGLPGEPAAWLPDEWTTRALRDGMAGQRQQLWDGVRRSAARAEDVQSVLQHIPFATLDVPDVALAEESRLIAAGRDLEQFLRAGGKLRKLAPKPVQKEAQVLLQGCRVDGRLPSTPDEVSALVAHLAARQCVRQLNERWQSVGVSAAEGSTEVALSELLDRVPTLRAVDGFTQSVRTLHDVLLKARINATVRTAQQWDDVRSSANGAEQLLRARDAEERLRSIAAQLPRLDAHKAAELADIHRAVTARDPQAYMAAIESLTEAFHRDTDRREARKLLDRLSEDHPELSRRFAESPTEATWESRLVNLDAAWAWRRARTFQDTMMVPGREARLEGELEAVEAQLRNTVTQLAADRALYHCLDRMTAGQKQALSAYASATANAGRGMTALGKRHLKAARSAMRDARDAVPAWVMPIKQVAEMIDPEPDAFDVVIVDEASQVGLDGLMLLWLAPRIIVVGDDKQCVPFYTGGKHERFNELLDSLLPHLTDWQRDGLSPKSNLYDLLSARFSETIRLTEHFRCMPEIIKWSSAQFYPDNELVPLRQYGADRLRPLEVVHVHEGHCEGRRETLVNRPEAERIVAKLQELAEDEAYAKRSFGVIVLRSGHQTRLLEDLIDTRIESAIQERHNIRVGTAEQFQGDERDVILLSLVVDAENTRALTGQGDGRRFNVAASRARDQMWLFTSVTPDQLRSRDLRHSLLTYMQAPPELQGTSPTLSSVSPDERCEPFDSLFEQRVFRKIKECGYHVVPQWKASDKRIDLVVVGEAGRLAVECDGSPYHSTPDQIRDDYERERELRRAGWQFWRVRSSEFALSPDDSLAPLWKRLDALGIRPGVTEQALGESASTWAPVEMDDADVTTDELDAMLDEDASISLEGI